MRLHTPAFERHLRRRVRQAVRASPTLRREARAARWQRRLAIERFMRPVITLGIAWATASVASTTGHVESGLAVIALWTFGFLGVQAHRLLMALYGASDLTALALLPVPESTVFRWQVQKAVRGGLWLLLDLVTAFAFLSGTAGVPTAIWGLVPVAAVLTWLQVAALATLAVACRPRWPYHLAVWAFLLATAAVFAGRSQVGPTLVGFIDRHALSLLLLLPTGWPGALCLVPLERANWLLLTLLVPLAVCLGTLGKSLASIRSRYVFLEPLMPQASDVLPETVAAKDNPPAAPPGPTRLGATTIEDHLRSREFLTPPSLSSAGPLDRVVWRWLTPRERALIDLAYPNGLGSDQAWRHVFRLGALAVATAFALGFLHPMARSLTLLVGLLGTAVLALARIWPGGAAFHPIPCSGVQIPRYAFLGIGYRELSRALLKCAVVQFPCLLLLTTVSGVFVAALEGLPVDRFAHLGLKAGVLVAGTHCLATTFAFSAVSNDSTRFHGRTVLLLGVMVGWAGFYLVLGLGALFIPRADLAWLLCGAATAVAWACHRTYGGFYHAHHFDLMRLPQN